MIFFCLNLVRCTPSSRVLFNDAKVVVPYLLSLYCNFRHMCLWYFPSAKQTFSIVHSGFSLYLYSHLSHTCTKVENVFLSFTSMYMKYDIVVRFCFEGKLFVGWFYFVTYSNMVSKDYKCKVFQQLTSTNTRYKTDPQFNISF